MVIVISLCGELLNDSVRDFIYMAKALADETRVRLLMALRTQELCVCQLTQLCGMAPSTVSRHLSLLSRAGLVQSRKSERWVYYRLAGSDAGPAVRLALSWVTETVGQQDRIIVDAHHIQQILQKVPPQLCEPPLSP